jgi:hypothetical protein
MPWESSFGAKVQTAREEKKRAWQDSMRQLNEARKMNVEQLKKKVEVYVKLGRKIPEEQIKGRGKSGSSLHLDWLFCLVSRGIL